MASSIDDRPAGPDPAGRQADSRSPLDKLERRVLLLIEELQTAREARRQAEAEAAGLREQVRVRDARIVQLTEQLDSDRRRAGKARERLKALVRRIDDLETGR